MESVLKYRNQIYGFLALWILFFHGYLRVDVSSILNKSVLIKGIFNFLNIGNCGVDVFLFLSGFCLCEAVI